MNFILKIILGTCIAIGTAIVCNLVISVLFTDLFYSDSIMQYFLGFSVFTSFAVGFTHVLIVAPSLFFTKNKKFTKNTLVYIVAILSLIYISIGSLIAFEEDEFVALVAVTFLSLVIAHSFSAVYFISKSKTENHEILEENN